MVVGKVGDQARSFDCICIIIRLSAFPVRMSYNVKVRSVPILARTEDSDMLKRTEEIVSVDVGKERSDIGALLHIFKLELRHKTLNSLGFVPRLYDVRSRRKYWITPVVIN